MRWSALKPEQFFAADYAAARTQFRAAATALGWRVESHALEATGPAGEELATDIAISEARGAHDEDHTHCAVISSGLHGVEAFLGSAVQCAVMHGWAEQPETHPPQRVVFIHALNPYGFAWLRRTDQDNIDLNRNFLLEGEAYRGGPPGYAQLDSFLNPRRPPARWDAFVLRALGKIARWGLPALRSAIAAGQYDFPQGLFYGGARSSWTKRTLQAHLPRWLGASRGVVHIDFHSGLGKWGTYKLLIDYALGPAQRSRLSERFGAANFEEQGARSVSYETRGGLGSWCVASNPGRDYLFAFAEFGAYDILRTLAGLRAENQAHHWERAGDASSARAKARLKELLCPASVQWRQRVMEQGVALVHRAVQPPHRQ